MFLPNVADVGPGEAKEFSAKRTDQDEEEAEENFTISTNLPP